MKKFRFRYQNILRVRKINEDLAQRKLADCQKNLNEENVELEKIDQRHSEILDLTGTENGNIDIENSLLLREFLVNDQVFRKKQVENVLEKKQILYFSNSYLFNALSTSE